MSYVYKNITNQPHLIAVMNESRTDVSHIPLAPGARIEVSDPSLDNYMPHILARLNEAGTDITHIILRQREQQKKSDEDAAKRLLVPASKVEKKAEAKEHAPAEKTVEAKEKISKIEKDKKV